MSKWRKCLLLLRSLLFTLSVFVVPGTAASAENINNTDVVADLGRMGVDFADYPKDATQNYSQLLQFLEYGYDYNGRDDDYGLFLYVYNPSGREIIADGDNSVTLEVRSTTGDVLKKFSKYDLELLSASGSSGFEKVFYKFRVDLPDGFMSIPEKSRRHYAVSEVEIHYSNELNALPINVSGSYIFTGYIPFHGNNVKSGVDTLNSIVEEFYSVEMDLHGTTWKSESSDKGDMYLYEVFSVYFSVPDQVIETYGNEKDPLAGLREISGTYEEYRINGLLTENEDFYTVAKSVLGDMFASNTYPFFFRAGSTDYPIYYYDDMPSVSNAVYHTFVWKLCTAFNMSYESFVSMSPTEFEALLRKFWNEHGTYYMNSTQTGTKGFQKYTVTSEDGDLGQQIFDG